jgi:predicted ATPase
MSESRTGEPRTGESRTGEPRTRERRSNEPLVRAVELQPTEGASATNGHPWNVPALRGLEQGLPLHPKVTYLVGENGSGKSTILEGIAVAAGLNAEGGTSNFSYETRESHSSLWESLKLVRGARRPRTDFFLRAESLFTSATYLDEMSRDEPQTLNGYGGVSLHERSHGESFLAVMLERFGADGFYVMDEPEAALSAQNCLTCLRRIHELVNAGSQFIIATHSPIILAYPESTIYECWDEGIREIHYEDATAVRLTQAFLGARDRFLHELLSE